MDFFEYFHKLQPNEDDFRMMRAARPALLISLSASAICILLLFLANR